MPVSTRTPGNLNGNRDASWLFNGRLSPVIPYAIRGAIWNQGYANMGEGLPYYHNLHSLVRGWRLRWGRPEDVKGIVVFLSSSAADYITGTVIPVAAKKVLEELLRRVG